mmetsp:Transcript_106316/g.300801  ORF Transcript_106316/g.300801 Transcript_106316/m.300801 type:complete len:236 (-) Transcript_106316:15-722(-)
MPSSSTREEGAAASLPFHCTLSASSITFRRSTDMQPQRPSSSYGVLSEDGSRVSGKPRLHCTHLIPSITRWVFLSHHVAPKMSSMTVAHGGLRLQLNDVLILTSMKVASPTMCVHATPPLIIWPAVWHSCSSAHHLQPFFRTHVLHASRAPRTSSSWKEAAHSFSSAAASSSPASSHAAGASSPSSSAACSCPVSPLTARASRGQSASASASAIERAAAILREFGKEQVLEQNLG